MADVFFFSFPRDLIFWETCLFLDLSVFPTFFEEVRGLYGRTALHMAAFAGQVASAEVLLSLGAHIDAQTDAGFTALHLAPRMRDMRYKAASLLNKVGFFQFLGSCFNISLVFFPTIFQYWKDVRNRLTRRVVRVIWIWSTCWSRALVARQT